MKYLKQFENNITFNKEYIDGFMNMKKNLEELVYRFCEIENISSEVTGADFDKYCILVGIDFGTFDPIIEFVTSDNTYEQICVNKKDFLRFIEDPELYKKSKKFNV